MRLTKPFSPNRKLAMFGAILGLGFLSSCHFNTVMRNQSSDLADAERIVSRFYVLQRAGEFGQLDSLYTKAFMEASPGDKRVAYMSGVNQKLGPMKTLDLEKWQTQVTSGTDAATRYQLIYIVKRSKHIATESFELVKEGDSVRIQAYNVNSDALLMAETSDADSAQRN